MYRSTEELFGQPHGNNSSSRNHFPGVALDSATSSKRLKNAMVSKSESVTSSFGQCAREILTKTFKLSGEQHHHLIEQCCDDDDNELAKLSDSSGGTSVSASRNHVTAYNTDDNQNQDNTWRERIRDGERLANWSQTDNNDNDQRDNEHHKWSRLLQNGTAGNYGTRGRTTPVKKQSDKWASTVKQLNKNKKISARNEAKRIDQKSRWVFPMTFVIFNISYWTYYLYLV
ncbi:hypothetical protein L596_016796 [Steinernema carpocapsae]|uniref:Neurotransmitter-gated ion-channel transmembrane domain-containing protein n=1 Tax=Steinernema carpocapsae TaxID=34508 RepID=A0A4U5NK21_STECR|nr:hypothetical protein L596_016796 [Steinernema carpocapsae]